MERPRLGTVEHVWNPCREARDGLGEVQPHCILEMAVSGQQQQPGVPLAWSCKPSCVRSTWRAAQEDWE